LLAAGSHPDLVRVGLELRDDGKPRSEITVDQVRALSQRLAMSSQFGGWQLALVDPADRFNASAANALLKTLEEPASSTVIVLVADEPARLPATIRSRCQRIEVRAPPPAQATAWLLSQGFAAPDAEAALRASLGNPGRAVEWRADGTLAVRQACSDDLRSLATGRDSALAVADRWAADRTDARLWFASVLARDEARALASGRPGAFGLTARSEIPKLAAWSRHADRARGLLATSLRIDLLLLDLLRAWPARRGA
jgi:DNA polymerase-3 subunit delta'